MFNIELDTGQVPIYCALQQLLHRSIQGAIMIVQMQEFVSERGEVLRNQVRKMRTNSVKSVREAVNGSAETLNSLKSPIRVIARSSVKLTAVSTEAVQNLIQLQSEAVTAALGELALRLERATEAENIVEFVREQIELTPATRDRVVGNAQRAVTILKVAGRDLRNVAKNAVANIKEKDTVTAKPVRRRKTAKVAKVVKRAARKTSARVRKAAA